MVESSNPTTTYDLNLSPFHYILQFYNIKCDQPLAQIKEDIFERMKPQGIEDPLTPKKMIAQLIIGLFINYDDPSQYLTYDFIKDPKEKEELLQFRKEFASSLLEIFKKKALFRNEDSLYLSLLDLRIKMNKYDCFTILSCFFNLDTYADSIEILLNLSSIIRSIQNPFALSREYLEIHQIPKKWI